jgi:hypothetical protein
MATPLELNLDDVLRLKRAHPCGGTDWQVTRLGADIGLRCLTCGRRVLLERPVLEKRLKQFVSRSNEGDGQASGQGSVAGPPADQTVPQTDGGEGR